MSWLALMIGEWLLTLTVQRWLERRRVRAPLPANEPANDDEPLADYWRVYEDIEEIEALLASGRDREARDAVSKLLDVMGGNDEAALVDARWAEIRTAA